MTLLFLVKECQHNVCAKKINERKMTIFNIIRWFFGSNRFRKKKFAIAMQNKRAMMALDRSPELKLAMKVMASVE